MDIIAVISDLGVPIGFVVILCFFIKLLMEFLRDQYIKIVQTNVDREKQYIDIYNESAKRNEELLQTNTKFVDTISRFENSITNIEKDVDDIKDYLKLKGDEHIGEKE